MNAFDVLVLVAVMLSGMTGWSVGFVARAPFWIGATVGVIVGAWATPRLLASFEAGGPIVRLLLALVTVLIASTIGGSIGASLGRRLRQEVPAGAARVADRAAGGVAGVLGALAMLWLFLPTLVHTPGVVAHQTRHSAVAGAIDSATPRQPEPLRTLASMVAEVRFPEVFEGFGPSPDAGRPPQRTDIPEAVIRRVVDSTSSVEAVGCGGVSQGSAWTVGSDLAVTNAHVVAGAEQVHVRRPRGRALDARVVAFDPRRDIALLAVPGIDGGPLRLGENRPRTAAAAVGYPLGRDTPRAAPALVRREVTAAGRDIYGDERVRRTVLLVAAHLRHGDSGAPVVDRSGRVLGMVFAIAADRDGTAYALDATEIRSVLDAPRGARTGRCIA